jgi:topoisomerase-4 subunit A
MAEWTERAALLFKAEGLQKLKDAELSDLKTFNLKEGLTFISGTREMSVPNAKEWLGERAGIGKLPPNGFPKSNRFQ